jgi:hypothetical protein
MPFGRCPVCGASYHLSVMLPVDEWYRRRWPGLAVGDEVPDKCPRCAIPLRVGHRVSVRAVPEPLAGSVEIGAAGVVVAVELGPEPVFVVELHRASLPAGRFRRSDLSYVLGQPTVPGECAVEPQSAPDAGRESG